ncbi:MAG: hypothetical protein J0M12_08370 [Deltaproteobacteria bacterium]|nr:hypothetical protein [Deltaproteobacteria bacterium]
MKAALLRRIFYRRLRAEGGTTVLMAATVVLPIIFFLFSVSLDATRYMAENQQSQKVLDEIAAYAYRFLPFESQARNAAQSYLARYSRLAENTTVTVDSDTVSLLYQGLSPLSFPRFFGFEAGIPISAYSKARGTPFDALIVLDSGSSVGPALSSSAAWGDLSAWPPATFFANEFVLSDAGIPIDPRVLTQQCFNPTFSALKLGAARVFEYLAHSRSNAVGIMVAPGSSSAIDVLRPVVSPRQWPLGAGEASLSPYVGLHNRNALCAAAAEREQVADGYRFPNANPQLEDEGGSPNQPVDLALPSIEQASWELNPEMLPYVRARQALWSQARRENSMMDSSEVLQAVRASLIGAHFEGDRGGLSNEAFKSAYVFSADVPQALGARFPDAAVVAALAAQFEAIRSDIVESQRDLFLKIDYVLFRHPGVEEADFESRVQQLAEFFEEQQKIEGQYTENFQISLAYADSPESFTRKVLPTIALSRRTAVLSR